MLISPSGWLPSLLRSKQANRDIHAHARDPHIYTTPHTRARTHTLLHRETQSKNNKHKQKHPDVSLFNWKKGIGPTHNMLIWKQNRVESDIGNFYNFHRWNRQCNFCQPSIFRLNFPRHFCTTAQLFYEEMLISVRLINNETHFLILWLSLFYLADI